jgi:hypothetical protein
MRVAGQRTLLRLVAVLSSTAPERLDSQTLEHFLSLVPGGGGSVAAVQQASHKGAAAALLVEDTAAILECYAEFLYANVGLWDQALVRVSISLSSPNPKPPLAQAFGRLVCRRRVVMYGLLRTDRFFRLMLSGLRGVVAVPQSDLVRF